MNAGPPVDFRSPMPFVPTVRIDLDALRHNLQVARNAAPGSKVMAVIKADAYGHGLTRVAGALRDADALAVARMGEAVALDEAGIVVLGGFMDAQELLEASHRGFELVVHQPEQLQLLQEARLPKPVRCWLKVDTGMNRLGFSPAQAVPAFDVLQELSNIAGSPRLMTHLANADVSDDPFTVEQLQRFTPLATQYGGETSIANSAGILGWPESHGDWLRPGIMLYGASPFVDGKASDHDLKPVMTFSARLIAVKQLKAGERVGYGGTWTCPEDLPLGVVGVGYGDGYPRELPSGTPVLVKGKRVPLVGRVSMDMITLDLRQLPDARVGDPVVLWGDGLPAEEIAQAAGTIPYTLFCGITSRVRFAASG